MGARKRESPHGDDIHDLERDDFDLDAYPSQAEESESVWLVSYADMMTLIVGFFAILLAASKIDPSRFERIKKETTLLFGGQYQVPHRELSDELKKVVTEAGLAEQIKFVQTEEGVTITFQGAMFFDSGLSEIKEGAVSLLSKLAPIIKSRAGDFDVLIEGHTDDVPIKTGRFPSNWELSSVRACSVLRLFLDHGFVAERLKAIGLGSTQPVLSNGDELSRSQNRRVVIRIMKAYGASKPARATASEPAKTNTPNSP
jgi:chemotaxis protein MotB